MKIEGMNKAVMVLSTIFFVSIVCSTSLAKDDAEQIIISKTRQLYQELMVFKNDSEFHQVGFGRCCKYHDWMQKVEKLREDQYASKLLLCHASWKDAFYGPKAYRRTQSF